MGGPVLSAVDPRIFTLRYFTHCMACGFCHDACCHHGVDVDLGQCGAAEGRCRRISTTGSACPTANGSPMK